MEAWVLISALEVVHGTLRVTLIEPIVGDFRARQICVVTGSLLVLLVAFILRSWIGAVTYRHCLIVGAVWVLLTISFEVLLGRMIMQASWSRIYSDYDFVHGGLMPIGLAIMLFAPMIVRRRDRSLETTRESHA